MPLSIASFFIKVRRAPPEHRGDLDQPKVVLHALLGGQPGRYGGVGAVDDPYAEHHLRSPGVRPQQPGDRGLLAIHAVRYLCKSQKDRSSDEMYNWIMKEYKAGNLRPQIPDYAIDKHTLQGQQEGRNEDDFYAEGSKVYPEWEGRDKTYRERILKILAEEKTK